MEYNQDCTCNTLGILDDLVASSDKTASAIFSGGIYVEKNILVKEICTDYIETDKLKVFDTMSVQNNIKIEGSIIPLESINSSCLGSCSHRWSDFFCIDSTIQNLNVINANITNLNIDNIKISCNINNLPTNSTSDIIYNIDLESIFIFINIDVVEIKTINVKIIINEPDYYNEYHKIIFKQVDNLNITWNINGIDQYSSTNNIQIYEIINNCNLWKIINYNIEDNNLINQLRIDFDSSLNQLSIDFDSSLNQLSMNFDSSLNNLNNIINEAINNFSETTITNNLLFTNLFSKFDNLFDLNKFCNLDIDISASFINYILSKDNIINEKLDKVINHNIILDISYNNLQLHNIILDTSYNNLKINIDTSYNNLKTNIDTSYNDLNLHYNNLLNEYQNTNIVTTSTFYTINEFMVITDNKIINLTSKIKDLHEDMLCQKKFTKKAIESINDQLNTNDESMHHFNEKISKINHKLNKILKYLNLD